MTASARREKAQIPAAFDRLGPLRYTKFAVKATLVGLHGVERDVQACADLTSRQGRGQKSLVWAVGEEAPYLGYALPRLESRYGVGRGAAPAALAWAAQHAVMPALPGRRYAISRVVAMVPVSVAFTSVYLTRGRTLGPLIAAHWASDLSAALLAATLAARDVRHDDAHLS